MRRLSAAPAPVFADVSPDVSESGPSMSSRVSVRPAPAHERGPPCPVSRRDKTSQRWSPVVWLPSGGGGNRTRRPRKYFTGKAGIETADVFETNFVASMDAVDVRRQLVRRLVVLVPETVVS